MTKKPKRPPNRSPRAYVEDAITAASHPTRRQILEKLKAAPSSTPEREEATGENRYNLYHHLDVLEQSGLIHHDLQEGRTKQYRLAKGRRSPNEVVLRERKDIAAMPVEFEAFIESLAAVRGAKIPYKNKIQKVAVILCYP